MGHMKVWTVSEIEEFRKAFHLTRKKMGEILGGLTVSTIFKWERGLRKPSGTAKLLLSMVEEDLKKKGGEKKHGCKRDL